jgi:hypothetical protein
VLEVIEHASAGRRPTHVLHGQHHATRGDIAGSFEERPDSFGE